MRHTDEEYPAACYLTGSTESQEGRREGAGETETKALIESKAAEQKVEGGESRLKDFKDGNSGKAAAMRGNYSE